MFTNSIYPFYLIGLAGTLVIVILTFIIIVRSEKVRQLKQSVNYLQNSLDRMDEQAKLIVRTDLELNRIQDELDKKVSGLYGLQRLSRAFASTLDEKEVFNQIKSEHIEELGIQKALAFLWQENKKIFSNNLSIGYNQEELESITANINSSKNIYLKLLERQKTISLKNSDIGLFSNQELKRLFGVIDYCISPIIPKEGKRGFLFVGSIIEDIPITEGDEELITILTQAIGQALENINLFEASWKAQQELERRVEQRTHELTEVVNELKKVGKRKSEFVSAVSHELRTPLTSIKGYAAILLTKNLGKIPTAVHERLEKINKHSDELVHMVNDLLDISRIESGRVTMKRLPYNLKDFVEPIVDLLSVQAKNKNIDLVTEIPSELKIFVDKSQIERVFINLIGNAVKFTPEKGKINITTKGADNFVQVNISDTGIGIPKEAQENIFEEFYRVDNEVNESVKGTGLGLSLVKNIIEAHQGSIWIESKVGVGSTFSFLLPLETQGE